MDYWSDVASIIGVLAGLSGILFGVYQYAIAQRWKKSEFASSILEKLADDPKLVLACQMLDYGRRKMMFPEDFQRITGEMFFEHNWEALRRGLLPEAKVDQFDWQETLYRDVFDHFFTYLDRVNHYISINLIDVQDVKSLQYWVNQVEKPRFHNENIFTDFIKFYEYRGVKEIALRFEVICHKKN